MTDSAIPRDIGEPDLPVRAVVFSGGLLDTVMQLGVVHALLVSRAVPPDIVVGVSAGAINAVAMAEVLEAGKKLEAEGKENEAGATPQLAAQPTDPTARLNARIARFRQILDNYRRAPGEMLDALLPDPFQVEAQRPLQPLQLPIQQKAERDGRLDALRSRAGMINLYNQLLDMQLSIGTLARSVRVFLGFMEAGELRETRARIGRVVLQCVQGWLVLGSNLSRLAPLAPSLRGALFRRERGPAHGYTAGQILFRSQVVHPFFKALASAISLALLALAWVGISAFVLLTPAAVAGLLIWILPVPWLETHKTLVMGLASAGAALAVVGYVRPRSIQGPVRAASYALTFLLLLIRWAGLLALGVAPFFFIHWLAYRGAVPPWDLPLGMVLQELQAVARIWVDSLARFWLPVYWGIAVLAVVVWAYRRRTPSTSTRPFWSRLLEQYDLHDSLFNAYPLRQLLIRLFDPQYYGESGIQNAVEQALSDNAEPSVGAIKGKSLAAYSQPRVGLTVAEVSSGILQFLDPATRVVDGLLAATARVPVFPPQRINGGSFVDGTNVANEPTRALLDFLRERLNPDATVVHVYTAAPLPVTEPGLGGKAMAHETRLVDVVRRALHLQRYRDATLERRLTELYSKTILGNKVLYPYIPADSTVDPRPRQFIRAWVHPIEPDAPISLTQRLLEAGSSERRRELIDQTVAEGCRAALQVMMQHAITEACADTQGCTQPAETKPPLSTLQRSVVPCRQATTKHLKGDDPSLPGSDPASGPGLAEICRRCAIAHENPTTKERSSHSISLRVPKKDFQLPRWPSVTHPELQGEEPFDAQKRKPPVADTGVVRMSWPDDPNPPSGSRRPLINLLFSGGVFRGVYQIGVLNALSEVGLRPDVVAGASVGSITAAMAARALVESDKTERQRQVARLAATYMALDRLILTDRFADFIRDLTLRAGATRLSLRQADRLFRRFDRPPRGRFEYELRLVVAGLERLFYLSPFELKDLVEAIRDRRTSKVYRLIRGHLQEWLNRSGIESELLGAEPLVLLIREHVIDAMSAQSRFTPDAAHVPFDSFLTRNRLCLLATATNLTQGRLEILGDKQLDVNHPELTLLDGLLASSAFPAVFRPREAWELIRRTNSQDQYIDGGVIDNLPLDAVAEFLQRAACNDWIDRRPRSGPHLLFSASLQTELAQLTQEQIDGLRDNWPSLWSRTRQLGYNQKLDVFAATQRDLRTIFQIEKDVRTAQHWIPLDLEVVTVRPKWLCGTFAFHPMLGFRRAKQAASIAHGCATTLAQLAELRRVPEQTKWAEAWRMNIDALPPLDPQPLVPRDNGAHRCWFRAGIDCPFSRRQLEGLGLREHTTTELESIYHACGQPKTHQAQ
jgi:predicted acylesterase/phospholipase RssA